MNASFDLAFQRANESIFEYRGKYHKSNRFDNAADAFLYEVFVFDII